MLDRHPQSLVLYQYRKAQPQLDRVGWKVELNVRKYRDGHVEKEIYESNLPSLQRARRLAKVINTALDLK